MAVSGQPGQLHDVATKGAAYRSVEIADLPPRPLPTPLTVGYRRAPVLRVGADIHCDTNLILPAPEGLAPAAPTLYPKGSEGVAQGPGFVWERPMWIPTIGVRVHHIGGPIPSEFLKDRREGDLMVDIRKEAMAPRFEQHVPFVRVQSATSARMWCTPATTSRASSSRCSPTGVSCSPRRTAATVGRR